MSLSITGSGIPWEFKGFGSGQQNYNLQPYQYMILREGHEQSFGINSSITMNFLVGWASAGCTETVHVPNSANVINFITDILGFSYADNGSTFAINTIRRIPPQSHPDWPMMFAVNAKIGQLEQSGTWLESGNTIGGLPGIMFTVARIQVQFQYLDYRILSDSDMNNVSASIIPTDYYLAGSGWTPSIYGQTPGSIVGPFGQELYRYVSRHQVVKPEMHSTNGLMRYATGISPVGGGQVAPGPVTNQPSKIINTINLTYIWHQVPPCQYQSAATPSPYRTNPLDNTFTPPNLANVKNCLGKVNNVVFDPAGFAGEPGTVLFVGGQATATPRPTPYNLVSSYYSNNLLPFVPLYWEIQLNFEYRYNGDFKCPPLSTCLDGNNNPTPFVNSGQGVPCGWLFTWRTINTGTTPLGTPFWDCLLSSTGQNTPTATVTKYQNSLNDYYYVNVGEDPIAGGTGLPLYLQSDLNATFNIGIA